MNADQIQTKSTQYKLFECFFLDQIRVYPRKSAANKSELTDSYEMARIVYCKQAYEAVVT
jgi:hypothetical protein